MTNEMLIAIASGIVALQSFILMVTAFRLVRMELELRAITTDILTTHPRGPLNRRFSNDLPGSSSTDRTQDASSSGDAAIRQIAPDDGERTEIR